MKKLSSKKIVAIFTCCVILLMSIPIQSFAYYDPIRIFVNNQQVSSDVEPVIICLLYTSRPTKTEGAERLEQVAKRKSGLPVRIG